MGNKLDDKWVLQTYGYDAVQQYHLLYSISGHPVEQTKRIVLVEGNDDKYFYRQFTLTDVPIFFITQGCDNMDILIQLLHKDKTPFLAIQDSDFYRLDGNKRNVPDLFYTDKHDWEMTAMANFRVFISFMTKLGLTYSEMKKILIDSLNDLEFLSYYKWFNVRWRCFNDFSNINTVISAASSADLGDYSYITKLITNSWHGKKKKDIQQAVLKAYILNHKTSGIEFYLITGHHLLDRFVYYLSLKGISISSRRISKELMQSVDLNDLKKTVLYKDIKRWESKNIKVFED